MAEDVEEEADNVLLDVLLVELVLDVDEVVLELVKLVLLEVDIKEGLLLVWELE